MAHVFGSRKPAVLVVDADDDTRALYRLVLGAMAGRLEEACDGVEAYGRALSRPPDLLVTERRLPRMDGLTLVERVRALSRGRDCAVLMVTTSLTPADRDHLFTRGIDEILYKPCDMRRVVAAAQRLTWRAHCPNPDGLIGGLPHLGTMPDVPRGSRSRA